MSRVITRGGSLSDLRNFPQGRFGLPETGWADRWLYIRKFGRNPEIDNDASRDIYNGGLKTGGVANYPFLTTAQTVNVASTSAEDDATKDPAGTGCYTLYIEGLDTNYELQTETISMNGTTNVTTSGTYMRIYRSYVVTAGSTGGNVGTITGTTTSSDDDIFNISPVQGQTRLTPHTVRAGYTAYLVRHWAYMNRTNTSGSSDIEFLIRPFGEAWRSVSLIGVVGGGQSGYEHNEILPFCMEEKTDMRMRGTVSANNTDISAGFDLIMLKNADTPG